jgi:biotin transport system substrate-specific component
MNSSKAFIPSAVGHLPNKYMVSFLSVCMGVSMLALLAQIKISLPWTPVPITGQTFGVALLALLWGSRLSFATFATYLGLGFIGAPIFAGGMSGLLIGPTFGYLAGMFIASGVVGVLSDKGWGRSFWRGLAAAYIGSLIIFSCGILVLSFFIPKSQLLIAGVLPFLPGDLIKNILAAMLVSRLPTENK